jgi:cellulose synthase operon protein C
MRSRSKAMRDTLRAAAARRAGAHPSDETLVAYRRNELAAEADAQVREHLLTCRECASVVLALADEERAARRPRIVDAIALGWHAVVGRLRGSTNAGGNGTDARAAIALRHAWAPALAASAVAIAVIAVIWQHGTLPGQPPLSAYTFELRGALATQRAPQAYVIAPNAGAEPPAPPLRFAREGRLEILLRPQQIVTGPIDVLAFRLVGGVLHPWSAPVEVSREGAVRIAGRIGEEIALPAGESTLIVAIGRAQRMPRPETIVERLESTPAVQEADWAAWRVTVQIVEDAQANRPIAYTGCSVVRAGPTCLLGAKERSLLVWIGGDDAGDVEIASGGAVAEEGAVPDGRLLRVDVDADAPQLVLADNRREWRWTLALARLDVPDWLRDAGELDEDRPDEAIALAARHREPGAPGRADALGTLGRAELARGHWKEAEELLRESMLAHRDDGNLSERVRQGTNLLWLLIERGDLAQANATLADLQTVPDLPAELSFDLDYYAGMLAEEAGDLRYAMRSMTRALDLAQRLDLQPRRQYAEELLTRQLEAIGRGAADASAAGDPTGAADVLAGEPCARAHWLSNVGWGRILERESGKAVAPAIAELEQAVALFRGACGEPDGLINALLNLAIALEQAERAAEAENALAQYRALDPDPAPRYATWSLEVEARLALRDGDAPRSLATYDRLRALAAAQSPESRWRAAVGRGRALAAMNDSSASDAYEEAERMLWAESLLVPVHAGRDTFVSGRDVATREYVDLLLRADRAADALAVVRRSRARYLHSVRLDGSFSPKIAAYLDERGVAQPEDVWGLSDPSRAGLERRLRRVRSDLLALLDELSTTIAAQTDASALTPPPVAAGELLLAWYPLQADWAAFAATTSGVRVQRVPAPVALDDPAALGASLLSPFERDIDEAQIVRVLAYGPLRAVDIHALPLGDRPLFAHKPVVYGLDVPWGTSGPRPPLQALVVGDPGGDLPNARSEARAVAGVLASRAPVDTLIGDVATRERVSARIATATFFHYAGHAAFSGRGGWESELRLAGDGTLKIDDVLTLAHTPASVVISGCEGGETDADVPAEGMGLAHAFLLAGAEVVVAPTRRVRDADAEWLMRAFYEHWAAGESLAVALQRAQLELVRTRPGADGAAFRALVR